MELHVLLGTCKEHVNFYSFRQWSCKSSSDRWIHKDSVLWKKGFLSPSFCLPAKVLTLKKRGSWLPLSIPMASSPYQYSRTRSLCWTQQYLLIVVIPAGTRVHANDMCLPLRWWLKLDFLTVIFTSLRHTTGAGTFNTGWGKSHDSSTAGSSSCTWQGQGS